MVIVCRLPAGGHYYTSCARSRHREATTPATLLLTLPLGFSSSFILLVLPAFLLRHLLLSLRAPSAASAFGSSPHVAGTPTPVLLPSPRIIRGRITRFPQGFFICCLRSREFANNFTWTFSRNTPRGGIKRPHRGLRGAGTGVRGCLLRRDGRFAGVVEFVN